MDWKLFHIILLHPNYQQTQWPKLMHPISVCEMQRRHNSGDIKRDVEAAGKKMLQLCLLLLLLLTYMQ